VLLAHPVVSLKHYFDPTLSKLSRFFALYTRITAVMTLSFYLLNVENSYENDDTPVGEAAGMTIGLVFALAILFLPLPAFLFNLCRTKY